MISLARMLRAALVALVAAVWCITSPGWAQSATKTLRFIPQADLRSIDPIWTTAYVTRNFGYMVFDTLFALDKDLKPQPQMVEHGRSATTGSSTNSPCATGSNGMTGSRFVRSIASPRSNAGASVTRSARN
jgi:peptide/nickel transport system substrate-binding protein